MLLCAIVTLGFGAKVSAQVSDVSVVIAPTAQYTWWDNNLSLNDTPFWGVRAGFGFGPIVELRALYERSYDLKGSLKKVKWAVPSNWLKQIPESKVDISRYGAELKVNLWPNTIFTPYVTAGSGILDFEYNDAVKKGDKYKEAQLYGALGAGIKINLAKRVTLNLEAKNTMFHLNKNNRYHNTGVSSDKLFQNWSAGAGLNIYLGGTNYENESAISRAYRNLYSSGFRGMKFVLEPGMSYINFDKGSVFNDQYFLGGSAGIDFSSLIGIRGFYYQATQDPAKLQFKFNRDMKMYGGNIIARLNFPRGITPYVTLGGGYLDVKAQSYNSNPGVKSGYFAFAGAGLEVPFSKYFALFGNVNEMVTQQDNPDISKITEPSDVKLNLMFQAGLRINIGASNRNGDLLYRQQLDKELAQQREMSLEEINNLRADKKSLQDSYEKKITELNNQLAEAALHRDTVKIVKVLREKQEVERQQSQEIVSEPQVTQPRGTVAITPDQFKSLVNNVVKSIENSNVKRIQNCTKAAPQSSLSDLDKILLINALQNGQLRNLQAQPQFVVPQAQQIQEPVNNTAVDNKTNALLERMTQLIEKMDQSYNNLMTMNALQNQKVSQAAQTAAEIAAESAVKNTYCNSAPISKVQDDSAVVFISDNNAATTASTPVVAKSCDFAKGFYGFNKLAVIAGGSYSNMFQLNLGVRAYMPISTSDLEFVPELLLGFGNGTEFGLSGNVVYNLRLKAIPVVTPYVGLGLGYFSSINGASSNVILGVSFKNILNGNLFADYSVRGAFKENVLSVGYRFAF